jgi:hypothetical protein
MKAIRQRGVSATVWHLQKKALFTAVFSCVTLWHCVGCTRTESVIRAVAGDLQAGIAGLVAELCGDAGH